MKKIYKDEDIKKALEQADANMKIEEVIVPQIDINKEDDKNSNKVLRKDLKK